MVAPLKKSIIADDYLKMSNTQWYYCHNSKCKMKFEHFHWDYKDWPYWIYKTHNLPQIHEGVQLLCYYKLHVDDSQAHERALQQKALTEQQLIGVLLG